MAFVYQLNLALLFGGMLTFQLLFAPLVFIKLDNQVARQFIRDFFPFYYLYFGLFSLSAIALCWSLSFGWQGGVNGLCFLGFVVARQILMPMANRASDSGDKLAFSRYHRATVIINTLQLGLFTFLIYSNVSLPEVV